MRVLYFHQHFSTPKGSTGIRSYEMARKLVSKGHEVTMVCGSYGGGNTGLDNAFVKGKRTGRVDSIDVIEFELNYANEQGFVDRVKVFLLFALRSIQVVFTEKYDVIFATTTPLTAAIPGIVARWVRRKPFVFEVRDLWPELPREMGVITNPVVLALMSALEWAAYKSATALIALSPGIQKGIERLGIPASRIKLIPNGCDLGIFNNQKEIPLQPDCVNDDDFVAVYTGTHGPANGLGIVIETAQALKSRGRDDIKLLLIGQGKEKQALMEDARNRRLSNIIFHPPVDKATLSRLMLRADVGMQLLANVPAFYFGTSPNKFFDYISAGLPVINNYPGWLAGMINETCCGVTVPPDDPVAFADALVKLADDRSVLIPMGKAAQGLAETRFDRNKLSDDFVAWLEMSAGFTARTPLTTH